MYENLSKFQSKSALGPRGKILMSVSLLLPGATQPGCSASPHCFTSFSLTMPNSTHSSLSFQRTSHISLPRWQPQRLGLPTLLVPHSLTTEFPYPVSKTSFQGIQLACLEPDLISSGQSPGSSAPGPGPSMKAYIESTCWGSLKSLSLKF